MDFNDVTKLEKLKLELKKVGVIFDDGLTEEEIIKAEQKFQFKFPPDLKSFLKYAMPIRFKGEASTGFPNWRDLNSEYLADIITRPLEGIFLDIEDGGFWLKSLGTQPVDFKESCRIIEEAYRKAPRLIHILGHRFIPDSPNEVGNPVFSVMQTDIIYYGANLYDYFQTEFLGRPHLSSGDPIKPIKFWKEIIDHHLD